MKVNVRNDSPTTRVRSTDVPFFRISNSNVFQTATSTGSGGDPIGLLLALTYASSSTTTTGPGGEGPVVRIRSND